MAGTITQTVLQLLRQLEQGQDQRAALAFLVEQAIVSTRRQLEAFLEHAPQNPEFTPELTQRVEGALLELQSGFEQVKAQMGMPLQASWSELARRLEQALERLQQLQSDYQESLQQGPTSHAQLNRLMRHLQAWESSGHRGPLGQDLIDSLSDFERQMSCWIDSQETNLQPGLHGILADLMNTCDEVVVAFQHGQASAENCSEWRSRLTHFSHDLDLTLSLAMESQLAEGPTPLAAVNLVTLDLERFLDQEISAEALSESLIHCEFLLRSQLTEDADVTVLEAADNVFSAMQSLQSALESADEEELMRHQGNLISAADHLARYTALLSCDESLLDLVSSEGVGTQTSGSEGGLPLLLAEILQQCNHQISGHGGQGVKDCRDALQSLIRSTKSQLRIAKDPPPVKDRARQILEILDRVCSCLDEFVVEPGPQLYANLEQLLYHAGELALDLAPSSD